VESLPESPSAGAGAVFVASGSVFLVFIRTPRTSGSTAASSAEKAPQEFSEVSHSSRGRAWSSSSTKQAGN
jgi:hypothetical protein